MLEKLKEEVYAANLELEKKNLVVYTWGNASGIDRQQELVVIKPSGVAYADLRPEKMVVVDFKGNVIEGDLRPSSDTETHLELYRSFPGVGGVVHTHSRWATIWAQAQNPIPPLGTTHADHFYGEIPCTRLLFEDEIQKSYELNTGRVIVETFEDRDPGEIPAVLVAAHGPFCWGEDPRDAVYNSVVLEELAQMAYCTRQLNPEITRMQGALLDKHFLRKHGEEAYYGQKDDK